MNDYKLIPHYSIKPNSITIYDLPEKKYYSNQLSLKGLKMPNSGLPKGWENLKDNQNKFGELSKNAQKRLRQKLEFMMYLTKPKKVGGRKIKNKYQNYITQLEKGQKYKEEIQYKLTFITLTLPSKQVHSDEDIKSKCLNQFLVELRKNHKVKRYIWKAEKQENGNIHFHILTEKYIQWQKIRKIWNRIIGKLGYIKEYQKNMKSYYKNGFIKSKNPKDTRSLAQQKKAYHKGIATNWTNPNTTDIHALYKIKNIQAYISKYLAKGVTKTKRIGQIEKVLEKIDHLNNEIDKISSEINFLDWKNEKWGELIEKRESLKNELTKFELIYQNLRDQGVNGRIWGCSQELSKCTGITFQGNAEELQEFKWIYHNYKHVSIYEVGKKKVITLYFDINKTPLIKSILDDHLSSIILN